MVGIYTSNKMTASAESDIIPKFSDLSLSLPRVDDSHDNLPDSDHKAMDQVILKTFRSDILLKTPPLLDLLLFVITNGDKRLKSFSNDKTEALLSKHPNLAEVLQRSWDAQSFKEVWQLGTCTHLNSSEFPSLIFDKKFFGHQHHLFLIQQGNRSLYLH